MCVFVSVVYRDGNASESEAELDGPHNEVLLPQDLSGLNVKSSRSAIRLTEIGPRMTLQLVKVQEGLCDGDVLYHEFVTKTPDEIRTQKLARERKRKVKSERRRQQEENVARKKAKLEAERRESRRAAGLGDNGSHDDDEMAEGEDDPSNDRLVDDNESDSEGWFTASILLILINVLSLFVCSYMYSFVCYNNYVC